MPLWYHPLSHLSDGGIVMETVVAATVVVGAGVVHVDTGAEVELAVEVLQTNFLDPVQTTSSHFPVSFITIQSCF